MVGSIVGSILGSIVGSIVGLHVGEAVGFFDGGLLGCNVKSISPLTGEFDVASRDEVIDGILVVGEFVVGIADGLSVASVVITVGLDDG